MDTVELVMVGLVVIWISHFIWRWRHPKCTNGVLPPGSMGFPLIGETLSLVVPSYSLDLHPFIKSRVQRYGPIFKTNIAGRPAVISADPELNSFLFQQEGKLVELWYLDTASNIFGTEGESRVSATGFVHKYLRSIYLNHFGAEKLKAMMPQIEEAVDKTLDLWSTRDSVEVKRAASTMLFDFSAKKIIDYNAETSTTSLSEEFGTLARGMLSFPLNIPGTTYNKCLKIRKKMVTMLRDIIKERIGSQEPNKGDFLDQAINDMGKEQYLSEDFIVNLVFGGLFVTFEGISTVLALALKLLSEHPLAVEEMIAEHESILKRRKDPSSTLTWEEYKAMPFTLQVINETLRVGSTAFGVFRRALKDIPAKGFTIPKGWTVVLITSSLHLNPETYENPLEFNPWRWKGIDSNIVAKNFMPFGGGIRQCAGAEYSRVFMSAFFHTLLTKYGWKKIEMGKIVRNPILGFGKGIHVKFSKQQS